MIRRNTQDKINDIVWSLLVVIGVYAIAGCCFDFFYDLNDDMLIKDILSGAYSGTPDGHTNQILYPLGVLLSLFYRVFDKAPVFGIFLCGCLGLCFFLISYRIQSFFQNRRVKAAAAVLSLLVFLALLLWELIYVQYTVVCGVLAGTACFWFYTTPVEVSVKEFWKKNLPALFLVWLAFSIRSEMLLLTSPLIAAVGIWHWAEAVRTEREADTGFGRPEPWQEVLSKEHICKYVGFVGAVVLGIVLLYGADVWGYRRADWQEYRAFFDARTRVYDYTWYPSYEEQEAAYAEKNISKMQYRLIDTYNYGLDPSIDENTLKDIAAMDERGQKSGSVPWRIKNTIWEIGMRLFMLQDAPYNYFVLAGYGLVLGLSFLQKEKKYLWKLMLLFVLRCIPWFYIVYVQRAVDRLTHPLYVIEFLLLAAMLVKELYDRPLWNLEKYYRMAAAGVLMAAALLCLPRKYGQVQAEQILREQKMEKQQLLDAYAKAHPENYYYLDVYSVTGFMEKMFENVDNTQKNYDLLGGWLCGSPLQKSTMEQYSSQTEELSIADALLEENFYFVIAADRDSSFLTDFYEEKGISAALELKETLGDEENPFFIYKVTMEM